MDSVPSSSRRTVVTMFSITSTLQQKPVPLTQHKTRTLSAHLHSEIIIPLIPNNQFGGPDRCLRRLQLILKVLERHNQHFVCINQRCDSKVPKPTLLTSCSSRSFPSASQGYWDKNLGQVKPLQRTSVENY